MPQRKRVKSLEPQEVQTLLDAIPLTSLASFRNRCLCQLSWECALRPGEALGIRNSHVNLASKRLYVPPFKYSDERYVWWETDLLTTLLTTYRQKLKGKAVKSEWLFPSLHRNAGEPLAYRAYNYSFQHYAELAGLGYVHPTPHTLRHSRANYLRLYKNADLRQLQVLLGHRRLDTTAIYTAVSDAEIRELMTGG